MHSICPSGPVMIPNHFNSLVKLAKHFLISLSAVTAQCWETELRLWRVAKMESKPDSCAHFHSFIYAKPLHHMWSRDGIIYIHTKHTFTPTHTTSKAQLHNCAYAHTDSQKTLQISHLWFKSSCAGMHWQPTGCCQVPSRNRQGQLSSQQPLLRLSFLRPSMVKGIWATGLTDSWAPSLELPAGCPRKHSRRMVEQRSLWLRREWQRRSGPLLYLKSQIHTCGSARTHTHTQIEQWQCVTENHSAGQKKTRKAVCLLSHWTATDALCN